MCLVKVREEEEVVIPYRRVVRTRSPSPHRRSSRRISRTEVIRESHRPASVHSHAHVHSHSQSYVAVPAPKPLAIPAPQPVPVFVEPSPPPPPPPQSHVGSHHHGPHYVEVSPRSSVTSSVGRSDYVVHETEYRRERRRDYSPESSPRYEHFRYVEAAPEPDERYERYTRRERSRSRARSRDYGYDDPRGSYRETRERVVVDDGRRRREYRS